MKRTPIIFFAIVATVVVLILIRYKPNKLESVKPADLRPQPGNNISAIVASDSASEIPNPVGASTNAAAEELERLKNLPPPKSLEEAKQRRLQIQAAMNQAVVNALSTPITFYGKVVDQNGEPVPDANVSYGAADKFAASGSNYYGRSDANGLFSITGIKGMSLSVGVRRDGYYPVHGKSSGTFDYAGAAAPPTTPDNPAVLLLWKMGETEPLVQFNRNFPVPKNGSPVELDLATGKVVPAGQGDFRVECWTHDENKKPNQYLEYAWECKVSVPGGGLQHRFNEFDFIAPEEGYAAFDEIRVPQPEMRWQAYAKRNYFLKLRDGSYARVSFEMRAGGDHFMIVESHFNPVSGHRNLEFDPKKAISR